MQFKPFRPYRWSPVQTRSLKTYKYPENWDEIRTQILIRDKYTCQHCNVYFGPRRRNRLIVHHLVPLSRGGTNKYTNLISFCQNCHSKYHPKHM